MLSILHMLLLRARIAWILLANCACATSIHVAVVHCLLLLGLLRLPLPYRYGMGMAVGFTAMLILKKAIRAVPVVGGIAKPFLGGQTCTCIHALHCKRHQGVEKTEYVSLSLQ
jgi:hypothetical protein